MKIYFNYIFKKIIVTTTMMLILLTAIVWAVEIINMARSGILVIGLGSLNFIYLCSFILPYDATLVWSMAMFFGMLMTINQLQQRGEFLAFRTLGFSHFRIFAPALLFSIFSAIICYFITLEIAPRLYKELRIRQASAEEKAILSLLHKKSFNNFNGNTIYFENIDKAGFATDVIIWQNNEPSETSVIYAKSLKFIKRQNGITLIVLEDVTNYKIGSLSNSNFSVSYSKVSYMTLSSIIKPQRRDFMEKIFYVTGLKKLYQKGFIDNDGGSKEEFHNRILRPFYSIIMVIFIYAIMCDRNTLRGNEIKYIIKYILSFISLVLLGSESTKYFAQSKAWYLCYVISFCFLFYGIIKILILNYKNPNL